MEGCAGIEDTAIDDMVLDDFLKSIMLTFQKWLLPQVKSTKKEKIMNEHKKPPKVRTLGAFAVLFMNTSYHFAYRHSIIFIFCVS